RHTRSYGDWSSDVCSSDLELRVPAQVWQCCFYTAPESPRLHTKVADSAAPPGVWTGPTPPASPGSKAAVLAWSVRRCHHPDRREIGRASCRERVARHTLRPASALRVVFRTPYVEC